MCTELILEINGFRLACVMWAVFLSVRMWLATYRASGRTKRTLVDCALTHCYVYDPCVRADRYEGDLIDGIIPARTRIKTPPGGQSARHSNMLEAEACVTAVEQSQRKTTP